MPKGFDKQFGMFGHLGKSIMFHHLIPGSTCSLGVSHEVMRSDLFHVFRSQITSHMRVYILDGWFLLSIASESFLSCVGLRTYVRQAPRRAIFHTIP